MSGLRLAGPPAAHFGAATARLVLGSLLAGAALIPDASRAEGQDIEAVARMRGLTLPAGYYARVQQDASAFTLPNGLFRSVDGARMATRSSGTARLVVLPALFADSPEPHITREMIQASLFDGPAQRGTITEAYQEISRGALTVTGDVLSWVRTSVTLAEAVGESSGLGGGTRMADYFLEALVAVDPGVDFGRYDSDGPDGIPNSGDDDGVVDAMTFEFLEVAASCGGPAIWPHRWGIRSLTDSAAYESDDLRPDGSRVLVDGYMVQSTSDCSGRVVQDANVISHEFGHVLGLPDYYHPTASGGAAGRRWVLGCWALMAAGSWGCGPLGTTRTPFGPTHMSAHSKHQLGWLEFFEVGEVRNHEVVLDPVQTSGRALRIPLDEEGREHLYVAYRAQIGFDHQIPADGILIYHHDQDGQRRPDPASSVPYLLGILERDDNDGLVRNTFEGGNRGEAGDAWGVEGSEAGPNAMSSPRARARSGVRRPVTVHTVEVEGTEARIVISTDPTPRLVPPDDAWSVTQATPFERRVRVAGGTLPYLVSGSVPQTVELSANEDDLVVAGWVDQVGSMELTLRVVDALGNPSPELSVTMGAEEYLPTAGHIVLPLLGDDSAPFSDAERGFLDAAGNGNGRYDVGDARAWILAHSASGGSPQG